MANSITILFHFSAALFLLQRFQYYSLLQSTTYIELVQERKNGKFLGQKFASELLIPVRWIFGDRPTQSLAPRRVGV